jgi:hypothetical protein
MAIPVKWWLKMRAQRLIEIHERGRRYIFSDRCVANRQSESNPKPKVLDFKQVINRAQFLAH